MIRPVKWIVNAEDDEYSVDVSSGDIKIISPDNLEIDIYTPEIVDELCEALKEAVKSLDR